MTLQSLLAVLASLGAARALNNGFGNTPVMGYNTYNDVACSPNSSWVTSTMNAMQSKGLLAAGYNMFQIDCGWQGYQRQANGSITYDSTVFPNGIKPLSDAAHSMGFKWGMYTTDGVYSCSTGGPQRPGSYHYETQDAAMFAAWNADYLKLDNCYVDGQNNAPKDPRTDFPSRYGNMSTALQNVGIKGVMVCQWGVPYSSPSGLQGPAQWTPPLANSYRVADDIAQGWANVIRITNEAINVNLRGLSGPYAHADMDLLEVGNPGMTVTEQATHFAIWGVFKSALMISTNVPQMSSATYTILTQKDIISFNQDTTGPATLVQRFTNNYDLYSGPLANSQRVVLAFDQTNAARSLTINFSDLGISSATAKDVWSGQTVNNANSFTKSIGAHDQILLRLSNIVYSTAKAPSRTYYQAASGTLFGGSNIQSCSGCSNGNKVGYIQSGGGVTLSGIRASQSTQDVFFDYINCEIGYLSGGNNERLASVSVNGGAPVTVSFPLTGYNWSTDLIKSYRVRLSGFSTSGTNNVTIQGVSGGSYGPDLDRIGVV